MRKLGYLIHDLLFNIMPASSKQTRWAIVNNLIRRQIDPSELQ